MKIQCGVCGEEEATILCCADEAALCGGCDGRVHSANKLAGKHRRLSLHPPSLKTPPLCDICKEKRGFVFCQQDRAILCRDCDLPIHSANAHASKHSRFLLTGIRISAAPIPSATSSPSPLASEAEMVSSSSITAGSRVRCPAAEEDAVCSSGPCSACEAAKENSSGDGGSTISDYLMKMLPGWRVDDFLFDDTAIANMPPANGTGYCLEEEAGIEAFETTGAGSSGPWAWPRGAASATTDDVPIWLPPIPAPAADMAQERLNPVLDVMEGGGSMWEEEISMVPLFRPGCNKRCRTSLWS